MSKVSSKQQLFELIQKHQDKIFSFGVIKVGVFGSFARNELNDQSDVDFFMEFEIEKKTLKNFIGLKNFLEEILQRKVEIVTPESLNKFIGKYILKEVDYVAFAA